MPEISIAQLAAVLRLAMLDDNHDVVKEMQNALMGKTASAILHQDKSELKELLPALASLHAVAGRYMNGKYKERWVALWELVEVIFDTPKPLEQQRLAKKCGTASRIVKLLVTYSGVTSTAISMVLSVDIATVDAALQDLEEEGLVFSLGKPKHFMLTNPGMKLARTVA